jgi:hypothetical protein
MAGSSFGWLRILSAAAGLAGCLEGISAAQFVDPTEESIRLMRQAIAPSSDNGHLALIFGLRQLRDPALQPLFDQLVQSDDAALQAQGVIALGELDPGKHIDINLIRRIAPEAQEAVIASALDLEILPQDQIGEILNWDDLHPMARLFLLAELVTLKQPVDEPDLERLGSSEDHHIAGLACCLLAQLNRPTPFQEYQARVAALPVSQRGPILIWLLEAIRRYQLIACTDWVHSIIEHPESDSETINRSLYTLLGLDPVRGAGVWDRLLGTHPTYPQRVRFGLMLLAVGEGVPQEMYDRLRADQGPEQLIDAMINAGKAISTRADPTDSLIALLDLGHVKTIDWAMDYTTKLPKEQAKRIYEHLIDRLPETNIEQGDSAALAVQAAAKLFEIDSEAVLSRLRNAEDDSTLQQAIVLALFEARSQQIGEVAAGLRRIGSGRADSLALLLLAKHASTLSPADAQHLGRIAAGGGRLSAVLQIQAAWLYLKHAGQVELALAALFAP